LFVLITDPASERSKFRSHPQGVSLLRSSRFTWSTGRPASRRPCPSVNSRPTIDSPDQADAFVTADSWASIAHQSPQTSIDLFGITKRRLRRQRSIVCQWRISHAGAMAPHMGTAAIDMHMHTSHHERRRQSSNSADIEADIGEQAEQLAIRVDPFQIEWGDENRQRERATVSSVAQSAFGGLRHHYWCSACAESYQSTLKKAGSKGLLSPILHRGIS
jgi:hypothetical protein